MVVLEKQMIIRRRNIDASVANGFSVLGIGAIQCASSPQNLSQQSGSMGISMLNDEEGSRQVAGKTFDEIFQRFDPSHGSPYDNNVMTGHSLPPRNVTADILTIGLISAVPSLLG
jgi:hypothetical protein